MELFISESTECEIVKNIRSFGIERRKAEQELFNRYSYFIELGARQYGLHHEDVFNAYSDTFLVIIESVSNGSFEGRSSLKTYCHQIFHNKCVDLLRKKTALKSCVNNTVSLHEVEGHLLDKSKTVVERLSEQSDLDVIRQLSSRLSNNCQLLILLSAEGYSDKEIATVMKFKSAGVAKTSRRRVIQTLRRMVNCSQPNVSSN